LDIFSKESAAWAAGTIAQRIDDAFTAATVDAINIRVYACPESVHVPNDEDGIQFVWTQSTTDLFRTLGLLGLALNE
jgi:hypothetical protein